MNFHQFRCYLRDDAVVLQMMELTLRAIKWLVQSQCRLGQNPKQHRLGGCVLLTRLWGVRHFQKDFYFDPCQVFLCHTRPCLAFPGMPPANSLKASQSSWVAFHGTSENGHCRAGEGAMEGLVYTLSLVFSCSKAQKSKEELPV